MTMVNQDDEHLRLLSILYYVWGGLAAFGACAVGGYAVLAGGILTAASQSQGGPPAWAGAVAFVLMGFGFVIAAAYAGLTLWTGYNLARRKRYTLCFVMAALSCFSIPLGTALGVFTIVVLSRPSVKQLFRPMPPPVA